jgi:hypothetical protein
MSNFETLDRLKRIETKLVRFAEELGVDTEVNRDWLTVDEPNKVIYVSTMGRSLSVMLTEAERQGAKRSKGNKVTYDVVHKGEVVGTLDI